MTPRQQRGQGKARRQRRGRAPLGSFAATLLASPHLQRLLALAVPNALGRSRMAMTQVRPPQDMLVARLWHEPAPARGDHFPPRGDVPAGAGPGGHWGVGSLVLLALPRATRRSTAVRSRASGSAAGPIWPPSPPRQPLAEQLHARYGQVPDTAGHVAPDVAGDVGRAFGGLVPEPEPGIATDFAGGGYALEPPAPVIAEAADAGHRAPASILEPVRDLAQGFDQGFGLDIARALAQSELEEPTGREWPASAVSETFPSPATPRFVEPLWPRLVAAPYRLPFVSTEGLPTVERFVAPRAGGPALPPGAGDGDGPALESEELSAFAASPPAEARAVQDAGAGGRLEIPPALAHLPPLLAKLIVSEGRDRQRRANEASLPHAQPPGQVAGPFRLAEPQDWHTGQRKPDLAAPAASIEVPAPGRVTPGTPFSPEQAALPPRPLLSQPSGKPPAPAPPPAARPARRPRPSVTEEVAPRPEGARAKSELASALAPPEEPTPVPKASQAVPGHVAAPRLPAEVRELADALLPDEAGPGEAARAEAPAYHEPETGASLRSAVPARAFPASEHASARPVVGPQTVQREDFVAGESPSSSARETDAARLDWRETGLRDAGRGEARRAVDAVVAVAEESDQQYLNALFGSIARADATAPELALAPLGRLAAAAVEEAEAPAASEGHAERGDAEAELDEMARKVYGILKTRLAVERERLGGPG